MNSTARRQLLTDRPRVTRHRQERAGAPAHVANVPEPLRLRTPPPESGVMAVAQVAPLAPLAHDIAIPEAAQSHVKLVADARAPLFPGGAAKVTLCIFGWHNVQPGTLSWVFEDLDAALRAVQAMRNAVEWVVVRGSLSHVDLERTRRRGDVLAESP